LSLRAALAGVRRCRDFAALALPVFSPAHTTLLSFAMRATVTPTGAAWERHNVNSE
jgi:hypothetical protein